MYNVSDNYKAAIKAPIRYTGISGVIRLKTGEAVRITDSNIVGGSLSIIRKMNGRGDFRPGGVYSSELSIGLKGFSAKTSDLDGAMIALDYYLYDSADRTAHETVPLGRFYADGSAIKRKYDTVTLKADDGMMLFDIPAAARSGTLFELVSTACSSCGVPLAITQGEFEALPNGTMSASVNTARIQTERDLLMYIGIMTASFARVSRISGGLEFVPLDCELTSGGMIVPVREIAGNVRFTTEFSDDAVRITKLFTRHGGARVESTLKYATEGSEKLAQLELTENPLLSGLTAEEVRAAMNRSLLNLVKCINRAFSTDFNGDPALDIGDYVRLRGGAIDTDRGYATGMITYMVWRYRGKQTIKCVMPSSLSEVSEAAAASVSLLADTEDTADPNQRVQPKSQIEKQLDSLSEQLANGAVTQEPQKVTIKPAQGYPVLSVGGNSSDGGEMHLSAPYINFDVTPQKLYYYGGKSNHYFEISGTEQAVFTLRSSGYGSGLNIRWGSNDAYQIWLQGDYLDIRCNGKNLLSMNTSGNFLLGSMRYTNGELDCGGNIRVTNSAIQLGDDRLYVSGGELFFNGKRVVLEDLN